MAITRNAQRPTLRQCIQTELGVLKQQGATADEMAALFQAPYGSVSEACYELCQKRTLAWRLDDPVGKANRRKRYYLAAYAPAARLVMKDVVSPRRKAASAAFEPGQEVKTAPGFVFTRCEGYERVTERREVVEPFFSARRPGTYPLHSGTAIERALESAA